MRPIFFALLVALTVLPASAEPAGEFVPPRAEVLPLPDHQVSFLHEGVEKTRWHFDPKYTRPFFYPFCGPSGTSLTRIGHPGAPDHDHHRSVWFAHAKLDGIDFWSENTAARIRQKMWLAYQDGPNEALMASRLGWYDGEGGERMEQEVVAASIPGEGGEHLLEIQITLSPGTGRDSVELEKSNFGLLAVRVAKSISHRFGGGNLTNSEGLTGEPAIFAKRAAWMDYSGPAASGTGPDRKVATEGITFFDHPSNPRHPTAWHVRDDGWMGAAFCLEEPFTVTRDAPLVLRYLLHAHAGGADPERASRTLAAFAGRPGFVVEKAPGSPFQWRARRAE